LLYNLIIRFKALDVTSIFTLESPSMFSTGSVTDRDLSPVADNLLMLRYITDGDALRPSLTIVKTRGTRHDRTTHLFEIGKGGVQIADRPGKPAARKAEKSHIDLQSKRVKKPGKK
jgi:circadian clock protein KaiC